MDKKNGVVRGYACQKVKMPSGLYVLQGFRI
jgi:hypothetical protein